MPNPKSGNRIPSFTASIYCEHHIGSNSGRCKGLNIADGSGGLREGNAIDSCKGWVEGVVGNAERERERERELYLTKCDKTGVN
jgi:hypothetical protein